MVRSDPREQEAFDLARQFLRELDACATEKERIFKVFELVGGVSRAARREKQQEQEVPHDGVCVECERTVTALNSAGMCEGCTMQAAIDAQERS